VPKRRVLDKRRVRDLTSNALFRYRKGSHTADTGDRAHGVPLLSEIEVLVRWRASGFVPKIPSPCSSRLVVRADSSYTRASSLVFCTSMSRILQLACTRGLVREILFHRLAASRWPSSIVGERRARRIAGRWT